MAFKLKRNRIKRKKKRLTKEELRKKKLALMKKKLGGKVKKKVKAAVKKKVKSSKLNNKKLNEAISININITNDIGGGESTRDIDWSTPHHYSSAAGTYRKSRIDNRKY
tara:strand:+ start:1178 stop:1504 length:327 start_codon:yes stop_codon:yes gene_type:complete